MTTTPDEPDHRPDDDPRAIDAAFDEIVARIDAPGPDASTTPWPEAENRDPTVPGEVVEPTVRTPRQEWPEWDDVRVPPPTPEELTDEGAADEGHYEPPPPPPLPRGDAVSRWAWAGALGAPVLAIVLPLLGWGVDGVTGVLLVLAFLAGFGTLVSRLRPGPRADDGPDDGAIV